MIISKSILNSIMSDLNLTNKKVLEEGLMDTIAGGARKVANWAGNTNVAAAQKGLMFLKPDGKTFVSIPGVDPNSQTGKYLTREYTAAKYTIPTEQQKATANTSNIETHSPQDMIGNLKVSTDQALKQIAKMATDMEASLQGKTTLTSQESAQYYNKLINFIITSIKQTQGKMPSFPGAQPITGPQAVNQLPTNPSIANPAINVNPQTRPGTAPLPATNANVGVGGVGGPGQGVPNSGIVNGIKFKSKQQPTASTLPVGTTQSNIPQVPLVQTATQQQQQAAKLQAAQQQQQAAKLQAAQQQAAAKQLLAQQQVAPNTFNTTNKT